MVRDMYINSNREPVTKLWSSSRSSYATSLSLRWPQRVSQTVQDDHKDYPIQYKNNQILCDEKQHIPLSLKEIQWKLRQYHGPKLPMEGRLLQNKYLSLKIKINPKKQDWQNHSHGSEWESKQSEYHCLRQIITELKSVPPQ